MTRKGRRIHPLSVRGEPDLAALEAFLASERAPEDAMGLARLDGFLTAVAIGPDLIRPGEWLSTVWGSGEPVFDSSDEAQQIIGIVMIRYNQILTVLRRHPHRYPRFLSEVVDDVAGGIDWAGGFRQGVGLRPWSWEPLLRAEERFEIIAPVAVLWAAEDGALASGLSNERTAEIREGAVALLAGAVVDIYRFWQTQRGYRVPGSRVGRNGPCPCGSGRKYKNCCGAR